MANNNPVRSGGKNRAQEMMSRSLGGSPESSASVQKSQVSSLEKNFGSNSSVRGNMTGAKTPQIFRDSISRQQLETKTANDDKPKNNVTKAQLDGREFNNDQMGTQSGVRNVAQQSNSQQTNKTRPSDDGDKVLQQQDQSGIYISRNAPKTQRGGKLVDDDPAGLKGGAENNVSREFSKLLSGPGLIGDKKNEDKEEEKNAEIQEVVQTSEIQMENEAVQEENMLGAAAALMAANDNQEEKDQEVLKKIVSEMKKHGINIDPKEAEALLTSNFKVKFPWIMLGVTFFKWMQEIYFFLIGIMISFLGDLPSNLIGLIPGLGTLISFLMKMSVSVPFYVAGLAVVIVGIIISLVYKVVMFMWGIYYGNNAIDFSKRIGLVRKVILKYLVKRLWTVLFAFIPLTSGLVDLIMVVVYYFYMRSVAKKARVVVLAAKG